MKIIPVLPALFLVQSAAAQEIPICVQATPVCATMTPTPGAPTNTPTPTRTPTATNTPTPGAGSGTCLWQKKLSGSTGTDTTYPIADAVDSSGNVYVTGRFGGTIDFGGVNLTSTNIGGDIFLVKYLPGGTLSWVKKIGGAGNDIGQDVAIDSAGNVYVTGYVAGTTAVDFGGGSFTPTASITGFIVKYNPAGVWQWQTTINNGLGVGLAVDGSNNIAAVGTYTSSTANLGCGPLPLSSGSDVYVAKLTSAGTCSWSKRWGGSGSDFVKSVRFLNGGDILTAGYWNGTSADFGNGAITNAGSYDAYVARYSTSTGLGVWVRSIQGAGSDQAFGVDKDSTDNVYAVGDFAGTVNFGLGNDTSLGSSDIFLAKYTATNTPVWINHYGVAGSIQSPHGQALEVNSALFIGGSMIDAIDFGGGPLTLPSGASNDSFVASFTTSGIHRWSKRAGGPYGDYVNHLAGDSADNPYAVGDLTNTTDWGCGELFNPLTDGIAGYIVKFTN